MIPYRTVYVFVVTFSICFYSTNAIDFGGVDFESMIKSLQNSFNNLGSPMGPIGSFGTRYKPTKPLGVSCEDAAECSSAFSDCAESRCVCLEGFRQNGDKCDPEEVRCPGGKLMSNPTKCTMSIKQSGSSTNGNNGNSNGNSNGNNGNSNGNNGNSNGNNGNSNGNNGNSNGNNGNSNGNNGNSNGNNDNSNGNQGKGKGKGKGTRRVIVNSMPTKVDSCPDGEFCLVYGPPFAIKSGASGHCCPKPESECPVGVPHPDAVCHSSITVSIMSLGNRREMTTNERRAESCPSNTHFCHVVSNEKRVCCPNPCAPGQIFKDGMCYAAVMIGDDCEVEDQCAAVKGTCNEQKVCVCREGYIQGRRNTCRAPQCPGVKPTASGSAKFKVCGASSECGDDSYCFEQDEICCPTPPQKCPRSPFSRRNGDEDEPAPCNPRNRDGSECSRNTRCHTWFHPIERDYGLNGMCCRGFSPFGGSNIFDLLSSGGSFGRSNSFGFEKRR